MRSKRMKQEHQGVLNTRDRWLRASFLAFPKEYHTTLEVCRITGCVSARDKIRKLQANGVKIGPANLLRVNPNGTRVYGWRMAK